MKVIRCLRNDLANLIASQQAFRDTLAQDHGYSSVLAPCCYRQYSQRQRTRVSAPHKTIG